MRCSRPVKPSSLAQECTKDSITSSVVRRCCPSMTCEQTAMPGYVPLKCSAHVSRTFLSRHTYMHTMFPCKNRCAGSLTCRGASTPSCVLVVTRAPRKYSDFVSYAVKKSCEWGYKQNHVKQTAKSSLVGSDIISTSRTSHLKKLVDLLGAPAVGALVWGHIKLELVAIKKLIQADLPAWVGWSCESRVGVLCQHANFCSFMAAQPGLRHRRHGSASPVALCWCPNCCSGEAAPLAKVPRWRRIGLEPRPSLDKVMPLYQHTRPGPCGLGLYAVTAPGF